MEIEQQIWGATSEGEAVVLYTLRNAAGAEVRLCNVGAAVVSILVPDRDGHLGGWWRWVTRISALFRAIRPCAAKASPRGRLHRLRDDAD